MSHDFDRLHPRGDTLSIKWNPEFYSHEFRGRKDLLPLWVADMDFQASPGILARLEKLVQHGIFGYNRFDQGYYDAIIGWYGKRYGLTIATEEIVFTPGIVPALNYIVQTFSTEGDAVLIQPPVYYPFKNAVLNNKRTLVAAPLKEDANGHYTMDYAALERALTEHKPKIFIFCNPHNPVGRVWTRDELTQLAAICLKHNVLIVADEIHCDLTFFGHRFTPLASLSPEVANAVITCNAVSKTFNLAGLQASNIIITNKDIRERYERTMLQYSLTLPNSFVVEAVKGAYLDSDDWYADMLAYIEGNMRFCADFLAEHMPRLRMRLPEGTYLGWIDMRALGLDREGLIALCEEKAKVAFDYGYWFGEEGEGFVRINLACPRELVRTALERLRDAIATA